MEYFVYYLIIINIITFFAYGIDKLKAKYNRWRISENMLIGLAAIGGAIGAFAGMQIFRHKTKHLKFKIFIPVCILIWIMVLYLLIK